VDRGKLLGSPSAGRPLTRKIEPAVLQGPAC
jgi:hypothetical protein